MLSAESKVHRWLAGLLAALTVLLCTGAKNSGCASPSSSGTSTTISNGGAEGCTAAEIAHNKKLGKQLLTQYFHASEWSSLDELWYGESKWCHRAQNPDSTAFGIAQFLDATWGSYGPKTTDPTLQIRYGLQRIKDRYGTPTTANEFKIANGWY